MRGWRRNQEDLHLESIHPKESTILEELSRILALEKSSNPERGRGPRGWRRG